VLHSASFNFKSFRTSGLRVPLPTGCWETVIIANGLPDATGLVNVKWDSQTALMFDSDLRERAELVRLAGAAI
jgi:hypothetical protein